ncbi:ATP-binding cassette domain-containing protein, partial [Acinetobacter pittii]
MMRLTQENNLNTASTLLKLEHLSVQTKDQKVLLKDLNFYLSEGETLAIVGESGSGKSMSCLAIMGLLQEKLEVTGQVWIGSQNMLELDERSQSYLRGRQIAMIFQEPTTALNPLHRVEKIVGENLFLSGFSKQEVRKKIVELLKDVGIVEPEQILKRYPHELSGGQKQRVMIP